MVQKIVTFNVALKSTEKQWVQKIPEVYTNDLGSVSIQFNITDCTDTELTGSSAIVLLKMRDGSFFQGPSADVSRTLNVFSYTLKENEGNHDGLAEIQLIVSIAGKEFATQKYQFKVNSGLDSEVAREIMIYDWTTLTAEARAYIDQFTADEMVRDAEFDNNEFDRNTAFVASQDARTLAFGTEQANRGTAFTSEQTNRGTEFDESESDRTVAESGRVTAESNRATAESGRVTAESGRVTKESQRVTAESSRVTAESGRVTAESGRVTAETNRAAALQELVAHKASTSNPHNVTKAQVGLGNADNTSDLNKPVSTATQTALNLKANKVQEAWITPTLIGGWVTDSFAPQYMKDEMGFVHFRGMMKGGTMTSPAFVLPLGYRPERSNYIPIYTANAGSLIVIFSSGDAIPYSGSTSRVSLDGVTFKAV